MHKEPGQSLAPFKFETILKCAMTLFQEGTCKQENI